MTSLIVDIETTGFLRKGNRIHCIVTKDIESGHVQVYDDRPERDIQFAKHDLQNADCLIGHNLLAFDLPFLEEVWPDFKRPAVIWDSLILSRFFFDRHHLMDQDMKMRHQGMPIGIYGSASLKAWGYRLGVLKGNYGESNDWSTYTAEMREYCKQDVEVTAHLFQVFEKKLDQMKSLEPVRMEHDLQVLMSEQEKEGFRFDLREADKVRGQLQDQYDTLQESLQERFLFVPDKIFMPKRDFTYKKAGKDHDPLAGGGESYRIFNGAEIQRLKPFNPTSRTQLAWVLTHKMGMTLEKKTDSGKDQVSSDILEELLLISPEKHKQLLKDFITILQLQKWLGQLSTGDKSWLNCVESDGAIHHQCFLGTATFRQAHSGPNLGQVVKAPWSRQLFLPKAGHVLIGADLQGLELRALGHYLAKHDDGAFAKVVVEGDVHQQNADRVGCTRNEVKSLTYCFTYGGGDLKLGATLKPELSDAKKRLLGAEIRSKFLKAIPGLDPLVNKVKGHVRAHGMLPALDGRYVRCSAEHSALNYLLQSCGSLVSKRWCLLIHKMLKEEGLTHGPDYSSCAYVHDEVQLSVHPDHVDLVMSICESAAVQAGEYYDMRVPMAAEAKCGMNWEQTH